MNMFKGTYTAIVTPFNKDGHVDFAKLEELINIQAEAGIAGIVPVGTTGESPTLNYEEHKRVLEFCVKVSKKRLAVIAGSGANSTSEAIDLTKFSLEVGADATLQVTPYYNKPNAEGLYRHFSMVADLGLPVMLYNVPGRTSREIPIETVVRLSKHPKIISIKEAGGSVDRVSAILSQCSINVLSGDDSLTLPMMAVGATGIVSVASNVAPKLVVRMVALALEGKWDEARKMHFKLYRLFCDLFVDTNPIPVKAAMAMMGLMEETYRLPLCATGEANKKRIRECLKELKLI